MKCTYFLLLLIIVSLSCENNSKEYYKLTGPTMGTTYQITLQTDIPSNIQKSIDSILVKFNYSMSSYIDSSTLSFFNSADSLFCYNSSEDPFFETVFNKSREVFEKTGGAFDPSISPLVAYYGFGYKEKKKLKSVDTLVVKKLLKLLVFDSLHLIKDNSGKICIIKPDKDVNLDFNAIAPGYAVDIISDYLRGKGIMNFMIDIGGEISALGVNADKQEWVIGINKPKEGASLSEIELPLMISNKSLATSGNYRTVYESKGQKFAHIINPFTGMSQPTDILSATVIANDCITADAYATAFMVLGLDKSLELIKQLKNIDACFIYDNEGDGVFEFKVSEGFSKYYLHNEQNN
ncbi:MAG: FAD:protein FMN transferase [Saprospiraceae bacterium]|nr:FAD:protein FMN transferase [Saprospiraceae bacterium]